MIVCWPRWPLGHATLLTLHLCLTCRAEGYRVVLVNSNPVGHVEHML